MEAAPALYREFGDSRVLAVCEEIQYSEIPEQSRLLQELFETFNRQYFAGRLPEYKILVVYDVWYWQTVRCGYLPSFGRPLFETPGFVDFPGRQIFIRYLARYTRMLTMPQSLIREMADAATNGKGRLAAWEAEMARVRRLGAPVSPYD
jgi:hypothetical protein